MVVLIVIALSLSPGGCLVPLFVWARWLRRTTAAPRFVTWISHTLLAVGAVLAIVGVVASLRAMSDVTNGKAHDPSQKARALGEGISEAINCGALVILLAAALALWLLFGTWRWRWSARAR